ncbi:MAG TPA: 1,2-phenylacetyl-CoA epoxidase subunit PaaE [Burkholderiales bacterium]
MSAFHPLQVASVDRLTRESIAVTFALPEALADTFRYVEGQHLTLRTRIDGTEVRRSYSICAGRDERMLRIAIKRIPGGVFSNWANDALRPGQTLDVLPPTGSFHVPLAPEQRRHYVAFAAGSGITPILSILKTVLTVEPHSRFTLVYGNRASSSVMFREELSDLKDQHLERLNLVFVMSREHQDIELLNGRIDRTRVEGLLRHWIDPRGIDVAFICGPYDMMSAVAAVLQEHGVDKARIRTELFSTEGAPVARAARPARATGEGLCEVTVVQDGRKRVYTLQKNGQTLLDGALSQGVELPYSCKSGVCATCRCKLTSGEVDMNAEFALEDYEIARGFILACQSYPLTDKITIDYDQDA